MYKKKFIRVNFLKSLLKILGFIDKKNKKKLLQLFTLVIIQALFDVISLASIMPLIQIINNRKDLEIYIYKILENLNKNLIFTDINFNLEFYVPLIVILIMIISTIVRLFVVQRTFKFVEDIRHNISSRILEGYINSNAYLDYNSSEIAKSILSEVDQFIILVFQPVIIMLTNILVLISIISYLLYTNFYASIISLFLLLAFYVIFYYFSKRKLNLEGYKSEKANKGRFFSAIESFQTIKDIKIYSAENYFLERFKKYSKLFANTNSLYSTLVASPKYILEMIVFIAMAIAIFLLSISTSDGYNTLPILGIFAFGAYKAQPALSNVIFGINSIEYGTKIISNLNRQLVKSRNNIETKNSKINTSIDNAKKLEIRNLKYIHHINNQGIKNINFNIKTPSLLIIVGKSGSGKSTLLDLIAGTLIPQEGEVILSSNKYKLNPKISYLHQEYSLFDTSIAENIAFGISKEKIDFKKLQKVMKQAEIYEYVSKLRNNIFELVGENGCNLSTGQKQRIALARALYFEPDLLLLDEPTSALDRHNEKLIIKTLISLSKKITVIMSTHKINYFPNGVKIGYLNKNGLIINDKKNQIMKNKFNQRYFS